MKRAADILRTSGAAGRRAFTLVELLIVVGIIALLVSIIMPSLSRAKELARQAVCLTNQSNVGKVLQIYHADWDCFPLNYAKGYGPYRWSYLQRWALGSLSPYLMGGSKSNVNLRYRDEGEFPRAYVCPSADLHAVYLSNPSDKYHACYWTNIAVRANRGFGNLFNTWTHEGKPPGWDVDSGGAARIFGRHCAGHPWRHWRSIYQPTMDSLKRPSDCVFMGDTNNKAMTHILDDEGNLVALWHPTYAGEWAIRPGWGWIHGSLGFDRHLDKLLMSYVDGSARPVSHEYLDENFSHWLGAPDEKELTGDFLIQFAARESCGGSHIHELPDMIVE